MAYSRTVHYGLANASEFQCTWNFGSTAVWDSTQKPRCQSTGLQRTKPGQREKHAANSYEIPFTR